MTTDEEINWHQDIYDALRDHDITLVAHVPDAGHTPLIQKCEAQNDIDVVTLTTEEEGVGLLCGAWAGDRKGVLLLEAIDVRVFRADYKREVGSTVDAAANFAFNTRQSSAVLLSQKMIGAKQFREG